MTDMDTHDEAAAADFELGWSGERIAAARRAWGLAVSDGLPVWLNRQLAERAHAEGRSELGIIQEALTRYFTSEGVEVMDTTVESGTTYEVVTHREVSAEANFWVFEIPALGLSGRQRNWVRSQTRPAGSLLLGMRTDPMRIRSQSRFVWMARLERNACEKRCKGRGPRPQGTGARKRSHASRRPSLC